MKNIFLALTMVVQITVLGVLLLQYQRDASAELETEIQELRSQLSGTLGFQRNLQLYLEGLRQEMAALRGGNTASAVTGVAPQPTINPPAATATEQVAAEPTEPFAETRSLLEALKTAFLQRQFALENDQSYLGPLDQQIERNKQKLLKRGSEALHWIHEEVSMRPYMPGRSAEFTAFLLHDLMPSLSAADKDNAYKLCREALVTSTNEPQIRQAAAYSLREIDDVAWVHDVIPVITLSKTGAKSTPMRVHLLGLFAKDPRPEIIAVCRSFLEEPRVPISLRTRAVDVLAAQDEDAIDALLRTLVLEDQTPEIRFRALDALYGRQGPSEQMQGFLKELVQSDSGQVSSTLQEKARSIMADIESKPG
jgi:hypothetical protein